MRGEGLGQGEDDARSVSPTYMESPISTSPARSFERPRTTSPVHSSRHGSVHTFVESFHSFDRRSWGADRSFPRTRSPSPSGPPKTYAIPKYSMSHLSIFPPVLKIL